RRRVHLPVGRGASCRVRAGARGALPRCSQRGGALVLRHTRAARDLPGRSRDCGAQTRSRDAYAGALSRRSLVRHRLARGDGRRGGERHRGGPRGAGRHRVGAAAGGRMTSVVSPSAVDPAVASALDRAVARLLALQNDAGWWKGELETNVSMDAEDLLLRQFLGIRTDEQTRQSAQWIRSQQRDDGTWGTFFGGPADPSVTIEAYPALKLAGDAVDAAQMRRAREYILDEGGLERARVFTKIWFSLFGLWSWEHVPAMPPELIFLPPWAPLNLYDFACWARQTVAALTVVWAHRPVREIPIVLDELRVGGPPQSRFPVTDPVSKAFVRLDRALHAYERRPVALLRKRALRKMERWILEHQEPDGCWGGIQPPWVYSIMALTLRGYPLAHPVVKRAIDDLDGFTTIDDKGRRLEACQSPVWDTCLALIALADAGLPADHPALAQAARWLVSEEITIHGDWAV